MKFKTKEELIKYYCKDGGKHIDSHMMISEIFKSFKERIEFYKKYESNFYVFEKEQKELCDKYLERFIVRISDTWLKEYFNAWLFDICFGDI